MVATMSEYIRNLRILVFLLVLIVSVPLAVAAPGSDNKPNIVLVLMDNFGYGEVSFCRTLGSEVLQVLPNNTAYISWRTLSE